MSELDAGLISLNSSRFPSIFDMAPWRLPEIPPSKEFYRIVVDSIPHNSTKGFIKITLEEVAMVNTYPLSRKTSQMRECNVDVEPRAPRMILP